MRRPLVLSLVAVLMTGLAGCGTPAPSAAPPALPAFDQTLHDRLPAAIRASGTVRVATDASYAPMSFFAADGRTVVGVEPDLGAAIGRVLGVRLVFTPTDFTKVLSLVESGQLDAAVSAITDTRQRAERVDFVDYFTAGTSIVVQRGNPAGVTDLTDLCGKTVAVESGTTQVDLLGRLNTGCGTDAIRLMTYPTNSDALVQLRTGRAAAVLNDFPPASYLSNDTRTGANFQLASTTQYEPGVYGIAVAKDEPALREALQGALERLMQDGTYAKILARWTVGAGAVQRVTVNSGR